MAHHPGIAVRIREIRESQGLTQASLAARMGVTRSQVTLWETGGRNPSPTSLKEIAQALGVAVEWLATGKGSPRPASSYDGLDPELLQMVLESAQSAFRKRGLDTNSRRFVQTVVTVYAASIILWAASSKDVHRLQEQLASAMELALGA